MSNSAKLLLGHVFAKAAHSLRIADGKKLQWAKIGAAQGALLPELEAMFWDSVRCELKEIIRTLRGWQGADLGDVKLEDEESDEIYGFDTFIDQVSESSREFSVEYGSYRPCSSSFKPKYSP